MDAEFFEQLQKRRNDSLSNDNKTQSPDRDPYPAVPAELKQLRQWVLWREGPPGSNGKAAKVPCQTPKGNRLHNASHAEKDRQTWTDYQSVIQHVDKIGKIFIASEVIPKSEPKAYRDVERALRGIGFVFTAFDPYTGVDIDDCINEDGKLKDWAVPIVDNLKAVSYAEISPSGNGIKVWTKAKRPPNAKSKVGCGDGALECYDTVRVFTITGDRGEGTIDDGQSQIDWLCETYLKPKPKPTTRQPPPPPASRVSVDECLRLLRNAKNADKFERLFRGGGFGKGKEYESHSEADEALCCIIAFYSQDPAVIDSIFRRSGLMREKWDVRHYADGSTYGERTIQRALDFITEAYTPSKAPHFPTINNPKHRTRTSRASKRFPLMMPQRRR